MKLKKSKSSILIILLSVILLLEVIYYIQKNYAIPTFSIKSTTETEIKDELITALFMEHIRADSNAFYNNYFNIELAYYNYEMKIIDIKKVVGPPYIYITFGITPMIGAHNPVGYDEATYKVNVLGEIELEQFVHLKSYDQNIPEWLRIHITKPLPITD